MWVVDDGVEAVLDETSGPAASDHASADERDLHHLRKTGVRPRGFGPCTRSESASADSDSAKALARQDP
jgi:hypothetical protein